MQLAQGHRKRIASAVVLAIAVAVTASSALGRTGSTDAQAPDPTLKPCTAARCMLSSTGKASSIAVVPTQVPANQNPSFTAATNNPAQGMLHGQRVTGALKCGAYQPNDTGAYQFFLGGTFRGNVFYKVTYTVNLVKSFPNLQFCLGATFSFATRTGQATSTTLPNGLSGFAGLVPMCGPTPKPPCLVSKTRSGKGAVLRVLVPAVEGADPWGRS
jgi:hypothetical protein